MPDSVEPQRACVRVSIILPTFNRIKYLPATIESIRRQSFTDWELLIADDGSGPELRAYLQQLEEPPRIKVLWLAHSGNVSAVRNAATREARGEYVAFIDSDDVWSPEKLEVQMRSLQRHGSRDWGYTGFTLVDEAGKPLTGRRARSCPAIGGRVLDAIIKEEAVFVVSAVMVRRHLLLKVGGHDESLPVCGEYELWMRLAQQSEVDFVDQSLVDIRRHSEHSADDVAALRDLAVIFAKLQRSQVAPHLRSVLHRRRVAISANMARRHAICGRRLDLLGTLLRDAPFSWRYWNWWSTGVTSTARAFAPAALVNRLRAHRRNCA
jgi:glycosyltransferase involved in cell wall biosynthesis